MADSVNWFLAAPVARPGSLKERVLEHAVKKDISFPFLPPMYDRGADTKHAWAADMVDWLRFHAGNGNITRGLLSESQQEE